MGANYQQQFTPADFRRIARRNPREAEPHLRDVLQHLSGPVEQRRAVMGGLVHLSSTLPYSVKPFLGQILPRVDDVDAEVRTNTLLTISHCVQYFPHEFDVGSVLYDALDSSNDHERVAALVATVELARQRPDLATPRHHIKQVLQAARSGAAFQGLDSEIPLPDGETLDEAIEALDGGDLASRPVEDDLSPVGRKTTLSVPARIALSAVLAPFLLIINVALFVVSAAQKAQQNGKRPTPSVFVQTLSLYKSRHRLRLALRQSNFILPCQVFGVLPGAAPVAADHAPPPEPPDSWHLMTADIWRRDNKRCRNCGRDLSTSTSNDPLVDLKIPAENGGEFHPHNARALCKGCAEARNGKSFEESP